MPHGEDLDLAFRVLERGAIGFAVDMLVTHFPREMSARDFIRRGRLARSEVDLFARHRSRFGRAARLPPRLYPVVQALTTYLIAARAQRAAIVRSPRRMLRFAALCGGHFAVTVATILRPSRR
jgi:GT2 family glycosyltransferase